MRTMSLPHPLYYFYTRVSHLKFLFYNNLAKLFNFIILVHLVIFLFLNLPVTIYASRLFSLFFFYFNTVCILLFSSLPSSLQTRSCFRFRVMSHLIFLSQFLGLPNISVLPFPGF
jgi:hypothetical protein